MGIDEGVISSIGYDKDSTLASLSEKFNITRLPDYNNAPDAYVGHVFMTRPSLNIPVYGSRLGMAQSTKNNAESIRAIGEMSGYMLDSKLYKLVSPLSHYATSRYLPIVYNRFKSYTPIEYELKTVESSPTFFGHHVKYGVRSEEHKKGKSITLEFRNDRFNSIYHLMNFWQLYIKYISNTSYLEPLHEYARDGILDYGASIYYVVTKRDHKEIVYFEKLLGVLPTHINSGSIFAYNDAGFNIEDTVSVDFDYSVAADPMDPSILQDINELTFGASNAGRANLATHIGPDKSKKTGRVEFQSKRRYPFIKSQKRNDGEIRNYLYWTNG